MRLVSTALALSLLSCGPSRVAVSPSEVVNTIVRPASGQLLFCPGDPFQIEVVVKLKDGTSCSTRDPAKGCMGQEGVLDASIVHLEGSNGGLQGDPQALVWLASDNPLTTAGTGLALKAWLDDGTGRSAEGEALLKPVYQCRMEASFGDGPATLPGANGQPGPALEVAITPLSTPFYPDAALIRIKRGNETRYLISPSADKPVRIVSRGQDGAVGIAGVNGKSGVEGTPAAAGTLCEPGGKGGDGENGSPGQAGGNAGAGGTIVLKLDAAAADRLRGRVILEMPPGNPGAGGPGGSGGTGGQGGIAQLPPAPAGDGGGPAAPCSADAPPRGEAGKNGEPGAVGAAGQAATPGTSSEETASRDALFAAELRLIASIEATKAK